MDRQQRKADLIQFLCIIQRPDFSIEDIDDSQSLIESGLIDSLAMLQIVEYDDLGAIEQWGKANLAHFHVA